MSSYVDEDVYRILYEPGRSLIKARAVASGAFRRLRDVARARSYDAVLVHREGAPLGPPLVERALVALGVPYVFDFDDAIFLAPTVHPANRRLAFLRRPSRVRYAARHAAAVIAGNAYLADWARRYNDNVTVLPTPVDATRYRPRPYPSGGGPLVIGWIGSSTTAPYLRLLDEPLDSLAAARDIVVRVVGGRYAHPRARVEEIPWSLENEVAALRSFDIGVLPEPDDPWTRGKGAFKALLYMASAVPVVASRVGVNPAVVADGESGYCVDDAAGWSRALRSLADDPALREGLGRRGRERLEASWSLQRQAPLLAGVLRAAATR